MDFKHLTKTVYKTISFITLISTISLLASFMFAFDMQNGYFTNGVLPIIFKIFFIVGIVLSLACVFAFEKHKIIKTPNDATTRPAANIVLAIILAMSSVLFNIFAKNTYFSAMAVGADFFAVYIFLTATKSGRKYSHIKLLCLLFSALFPLSMIFDNNTVLIRHSNSVENTLSAVFGIAFLAYILYEGNRLFTGEHSRWHFASMLLFSHAGFSLSIAYMIAYITQDVDERIRFYQMALILIMSIFVEIELIKYTKNSKSLTQNEWDDLEAPEEIIEENINEETTDE